ncbi:exosome complex component RRP4-like isoform X3 [Phascolarctos cinereus]|uniref:Exosome complex component RRP4-like isoform X3 n=1 Tax=Phascolarctos cinereus TaxID=38626 RepID=A0A6P5JME1_PHACI|nr:exosome complex component RRP4-like isoform X3 [Phascolarctos cinereus]
MVTEIRLPVACQWLPENLDWDTQKHLVAPGDTITTDTGIMLGCGTYMGDEKVIASVTGFVERVNKLICVKAVKTRYNGEVADIVVGRITELRRRSSEDELARRNFLWEGDLMTAEVREVFSDGAVSLHTRSLKYGKLGQGVLVQVSPSLVKRQKTPFHDLPCGASVILGNNGFIWIYPTPEQREEEAEDFIASLEPESLLVISQLWNCIVFLLAQKMMLFDTSLLYNYEAFLSHPIKDILKPEIMEEIVTET